MKKFISAVLSLFLLSSCVVTESEKGGLEARPDFPTWVKIANIFVREEQ